MVLIGEASRQSGVAIETIRYYEREGILPAPRRAMNGRRLYAPADIALLRFVRRCRELGFSIADIRVLLSLRQGGLGTCDQVRRLSEENLQDVRRKIDDLKKMEKALNQLIIDCEAGGPDCPALSTLFAE